MRVVWDDRDVENPACPFVRLQECQASFGDPLRFSCPVLGIESRSFFDNARQPSLDRLNEIKLVSAALLLAVRKTQQKKPTKMLSAHAVNLCANSGTNASWSSSSVRQQINAAMVGDKVNSSVG